MASVVRRWAKVRKCRSPLTFRSSSFDQVSAHRQSLLTRGRGPGPRVAAVLSGRQCRVRPRPARFRFASRARPTLAASRSRGRLFRSPNGGRALGTAKLRTRVRFPPPPHQVSSQIWIATIVTSREYRNRGIPRPAHPSAPPQRRYSLRFRPRPRTEAVDVITDPGVLQSTELDCTLGPVVLTGATIPYRSSRRSGQRLAEPAHQERFSRRQA